MTKIEVSVADFLFYFLFYSVAPSFSHFDYDFEIFD